MTFHIFDMVFFKVFLLFCLVKWSRGTTTNQWDANQTSAPDAYSGPVTNSWTNSSNSTNAPEHDEKCHQFDFAVYGILITLCLLVCAVGNTLAIATFWKGPKNSPALLFGSLAVADLLVVITEFFFRSVEQICLWNKNWESAPCWTWLADGPQAFAKIYCMPMMSFASLTSVWITVLVTFNRYIAVCKPLQKYRLASLSIVYKQLGITVLLCFLSTLPKWFEGKTTLSSTLDGRPFIAFGHNDFYENMNYMVLYRIVFLLLVQFFVPLIIIIVLTFHLTNALRQAHAKRRLLMENRKTKTPAQDFTMSVSLLGVIVVHIVCQIPYCITRILHPVLHEEDNKGTNCGHWFYFYRRISELFFIINSSVNFFIFLLCSGQFRHQLKMLFVCENTRIPTSVSQTMTSVLSKTSSTGSRSSGHSRNSQKSRSSGSTGSRCSKLSRASQKKGSLQDTEGERETIRMIVPECNCNFERS